MLAALAAVATATATRAATATSPTAVDFRNTFLTSSPPLVVIPPVLSEIPLPRLRVPGLLYAHGTPRSRSTRDCAPEPYNGFQGNRAKSLGALRDERERAEHL